MTHELVKTDTSASKPKPHERMAIRLMELSEQDGSDLTGLLDRMQKGDPEARAELARYMKADAQLADAVLAVLGSAPSAGLDLATDDPLTRVLMERRSAHLQDSLCGDHASPLERLLIKRIAECSLQVEVAEARSVQAMRSGASPEEVRMWENFHDRAHKRLLGTMKALAQVQRLEVPSSVAQVNVGLNQVNVAQSAASPLPDSGSVRVVEMSRESQSTPRASG